MKARFNLFDVVLYVTVAALCMAVVLPLLYVAAVSFSPPSESYVGSFYLWPRKFNVDAYRYLLSARTFLDSMKNSFYITILGTAVSLIVSITLSYALSKKSLPGRRFLLMLEFFTTIFHGGLIPVYLVVRGLGLIDTYWAIILPATTGAFYVLVMKTFFQSLPESLDEAARIDGAGEFRILTFVVIPLSMPIIATFTIFFTVHYWNEYFAAVIYINDTNKWPIQPLLRQMVAISASNISSEAALDEMLASKLGPNVQHAAILLAMLPIAVVYPFLQKYFTKGATLGSIKE